MMRIPFVDLAYLKRSYVIGIHIVYLRCKTELRITMGLTDNIMRLISEYPALEDSICTLPIISRYEEEGEKAVLTPAGQQASEDYRKGSRCHSKYFDL